MTTPDVYSVFTPAGILRAEFDPEDDDGDFAPVRWSGDALALQYLRTVVQGCTDATGCSIDIDQIEPATLEHFCAPPGTGVLVIPSPELLADRAVFQTTERIEPDSPFEGVNMYP